MMQKTLKHFLSFWECLGQNVGDLGENVKI